MHHQSCAGALNKAELRLQAKALRAAHRDVLQRRLDGPDAALLEQVRQGAPIPPGGTHIGLTWPLPHEPDLRPWLLSSRLPLALPAVTAAQLVYRAWQPDQPLRPDDCGIPAPPAESPRLRAEQMALLLVPALAFDRLRGVRLGYGGGWYDRLRADPLWRRVPALAVLPSACVWERLPADPWDVPLDGWLDEHGCHWLPAAARSEQAC